MTWPRLSMNKIWGETHVEDTTHIEDKFKQVNCLFYIGTTQMPCLGLGYDLILVPFGM
jgi:hypothetical protein